MQLIKVKPFLQWFTDTVKYATLSFAAAFRSRIVTITAFFTTLYYLEIIFIMFNLVLVMGKVIAVLTGFILAGLLTVHIINLNSRSNISRIIQLIILDIHAAATVSFIPGFWFYNIDFNAVSLSMLIVRCFMAALEIPLIYLLTDESVKNLYSK